MPTFAIPQQTPEQSAAAMKAAGLTPQEQANVKAGVQSPSLLVSSSSSRNNYSNNVNTLNGATSSLAGGNTNTNTTGNTGGTVKTDTPKSNPMPSGSVSMNEATARSLFGTDFTGVQKQADGSFWADTSAMARVNGTPGTGADGNANPDNSQNNTNTNDGLTDGLPPALAAQFKSSLAGLDDGIASAKANLLAATATLANDPAATAAVNQIIAKYDQQINLMKEKNRILAGGYSTSAARNGGFQYANDMTSDFLSMEQDKASQRIADLVSQETSLILKAQMAYKTGDLKALNQATDAYNKANGDKIDAINKLLTATNNQTKTLQAQAKIDAAASKQAVTTDISKSTNLGTSLAKNIADSGETDPGIIDAYIEQMAEQYGITNPDILKSSVLKAQDAAKKADLANKNTQSIITKRDQPKAPAAPKGGGVDGAYHYTSADIDTYTNFLNKGGKVPDGTAYAARGTSTDGFVDPGVYTYALKDWVANGGTPAGFAKKFPVAGNVNPASYAQLPEAIRPKAKATTASTIPK